MDREETARNTVVNLFAEFSAKAKADEPNYFSALSVDEILVNFSGYLQDVIVGK